ncbi:MAG TPA: ABC transporter substrate-binding protein [Trebonia sp.]|jgi:ABC-type nitrate/sulfonate/bicarbonate transport system substrate-binding protein
MKLTRLTGKGQLRRPLLALAAAAAAVTIAACGSSSASSSGSDSADSASSADYTVHFGYINSGAKAGLTGPWGFAYSKGLLQQWLKSDGVTLSLSEFTNGPLLTAAMVGGSVDAGVLGDTPALIAKSQGLQATFVSQPEIGNAAWIIAQPSITSLSQLAGKMVARQQGSYLDRYVQGLLQEKGLLSKVKLVAMLSPQSTPAFEAGSLDAIVVTPATWTQLEKTGKKYNILAKSETTPSIQGTQAAVVSDKALAAHPNLATIWNTVRVKSVQYADAHAGEYYAWAAAQGDTTVALEEESAPLSTYPIPNFTTSGIKQLQGTLNFLVSEKEASSFSIQDWETKSGD